MAKKAEAKKIDTHGKSMDELKVSLLDKRKEQMNLRFQQQAGQLNNTSVFLRLRRDIARIKTAMNAFGKPVAEAKPAKAKAKPAAPKKEAVKKETSKES